MATTETPRSSWISGFSYRNGFLAVFTRQGPVLLHGNVPPHVPGLLKAGTARRSVGLAYTRLIKGRYPYQRVEGERVRELRRMMGRA